MLSVQYFVAPRKRGTFMKREALTPFDVDEQASSSIQGIARMQAGRRRFGAEVSWRTFNTLDADEEAQQLARQQRLQNTELGAFLSRARPSTTELEAWERTANASPVEPSADFATLEFPLSEGGVVAMMAAFRDGRHLHFAHALRLVGEYRRWAAAQPTLFDTSIGAGERLTVCGDLHGQLADLFSIYSLNGLPSRTNRYLMNGDFVDRGSSGCEVLFTLLAWTLLFPPAPAEGGRPALSPACLLNRGNHETHAQNVTGGFMAEVLAKYGGIDADSGAGSRGGASGGAGAGAAADPGRITDCGMRLYDSIQAAFECAPLATLISKDEHRVFVVHGGLLHRPGVTLAHIGAIKRRREIPYGLPAFEDRLFEDLMWSDPRVVSETTPSDRGAGVFFGANVTESFCALNRISLVVRSHECVPEGFLFMHDDRLVTVFSASRYCGRGTNKGAFLLFNSELQHSVRQYLAPELDETEPSQFPPSTMDLGLAARYSANVLEDATFDIGATPESSPARMPTASPALPLATAGAPAAALPPPSVSAAAAAIAAAPTPPSPEATAAQEDSNRNLIIERVCMRKPDLYFFFSTADKAGGRDGRISQSTWADGMRTVLNLDLPWVSLCASLCDFEADGRINYTRFLDRYRIAMRQTDMVWMEAIVERVCEQLYRIAPTLEESFKVWDEDGNGTIEVDELQRGLLSAKLDLSRAQVYEVMSTMDTDRDGRIQLDEFADRFKVTFAAVKARSAQSVAPSTLPAAQGAASSLAAAAAAAAEEAARLLRERLSSDEWASKALARVGEALFGSAGGRGTGAASPTTVFATIDTNNDGVLSEDEFCSALTALNLGFSREEMVRIVDAIDTNRSGSINYIEFAEAFSFRDSRAPPLSSVVAMWTHSQESNALPSSLAPAGSTAQLAPSAAAAPAADGGRAAAAGATSTVLLSAPTPGSAAAAVAEASAPAWQRSVIDKIVAVLFEYRFEMAAIFSMFDTDRSGKISRSEFRVGLSALTSLTGSPLTDSQSDELLRSLDTNGDGEIDWHEFVSAFRIVDLGGDGGTSAMGAGATPGGSATSEVAGVGPSASLPPTTVPTLKRSSSKRTL